MEKITLQPEEDTAPVDFYVVEQVSLGGKTYLLVTDTEEGDGEALILRDDASASDKESLYAVVEDDREISAVMLLMADTLREMGITVEE
ncbi:MAG: DUF1292 domain-containing protein [Lachnospiraceae bacterium]|nr:DUF1292 domain-containing protein [Lachnospiraceae bacterium]